tara:strand:+ start:1088 stop:1576 length:489 start_codon:yes stop_codon:yes gene_type:complete
MTDIFDVLKALWDAYGKSHNENQIRVYVKWARTTNVKTLEKVIGIWIGNEKFFPSLSDLTQLYASQSRSFKDPTQYEDCWFCGGVGLVPSIESREDRHYIVNFGCKCSNAISGIQDYFIQFKELEYKDYAEKFEKDGLTYPQIVDKYLREEILRANERVVDF